MSLGTLAAVVLLAAVPAPASPPPAEPEFWLHANPENAEEAALKDAMARGTSPAGPVSALGPLAQVSKTYPGTAASGLAQLAAGMILLEANRPAESIACFTQPDVQQSLLFDHGLMGLARAQEALNQKAAAAQTFLAAAGSDAKGNLSCTALTEAALAFGELGQTEPAATALQRALDACPGREPAVLLQLAKLYDGAGVPASAAGFYDRLDREYVLSPQAKEAAPRLAALRNLLPAATSEIRAARELAEGLALFDAKRYVDASASLREYLAVAPQGADVDLVRVRLARAQLGLGHLRDASAMLASVPANSPQAAEADFCRARIKASTGPLEPAYEAVADQHPGTPWGEEALLALANNYQKDALDDDALPYWRRIVAEYPDGQNVERAAWRSAWADYRAKRYEDAALVLERTARLRPEGSFTAGFLYWAARARIALGQTDRGRVLLEETVKRYKYAYHGLRARDALSRLPRVATASPTPNLVSPTPEPDEVPEPQRERVRQLLLIDRYAEAEDELRTVPLTPKVQATIAWTLACRGKLRGALVAMKRAFPEWVGEAGDRLPAEAWRIMFPLEFRDALVKKANDSGLDPALVAALILQESTFDPDALSRAGARGLMQVIPATGRKLARDMRIPFRRTALHDPKTSLDYGTLYLRQMSDRFEGHVERVLASYNAGPHRVDAWTAQRPNQSAEEFVESIPFSETRSYVMIILASREQYRRLYGLAPKVTPPVEGPRP